MTTPKRTEIAPASDVSDEAPPTADEQRAAAALRLALEDPNVPHEDAELLRAVALAEAPRALGDDDHRAIVERALARRTSAKRPGGRLIRLAFGGSAALAIAAGAILFVGAGDAPLTRGAIAPSLAQARSTQALFQEPFAREGGESARIDRIALARASDFRDNEFSRWGIR